MKDLKRMVRKRRNKNNIVDPHGVQESRRSFLKGAAVGLGVAVVPTLLTKPGAAQTPAPQIFGYPDRASVAAGTTLTLRVSTTAPQFRVDFYRQGATLTFAQSSAWLPGQYQPDGSAAQDWNWPAYNFPIPASWPSGAYVAMLVTGDGAGNVTQMPDTTTADGRSAKALFIVRSANPGRNASILYKVSLNTLHAYNHTGGGSLYRDTVTSVDPPGYKVTLRRTGGGTGDVAGDQILDVYDATSPRQTFAHWDTPFIVWLEGHGYTADYCTDLDLHENANLLPPYQLLLSVGHDEYWSDAMRTNVSTFVQTGGNVAFWSANTCWFRIEYADNNTSIVCNKPANDLWWTGTQNFPENSLTGVSYRNGGGWWDGARDAAGYTVQHADHWVYAGTGLANGQTFGANDALIGYECDGAAFTRDSQGNAVVKGNDGTPLNFTILGVATLSSNWEDRPARENGGAYAATMGLYTSFGTVFTCATVDWARVLGKGADAAVSQITANVMSRLSKTSTPAPPLAPINLGAKPGNGQVSLAWSGSAGAVSYNVKRGTVSGGPYTTLGTASGLSYTDSAVVNGTTYFYVVTAVNSTGESVPSAQIAAKPSLYGNPFLQINSGGVAVGTFGADQYYTGGNTTSFSAPINLSGATNPAPAAVYQSVRYGSGFSYSLPGLTPGTAYTVRLHFAEIYYTGSGQRLFNVSINGSQILSNFDIYAAAGAMNKAVIKEFAATADSSGKIAIAYADVSNGAMSNGVEVVGTTPPTIPAAPAGLAATAGSGQVSLAWSGSAGAVSYNVKRGTVSGGPYTTLGTASGLSYTDSTAVNGTTYFYVVTAVNSTGESAPSAQVSATPKASVSGTAVYQLNSGGGAVGTFGADQYYTGGSAWSSSSPIDLSGAANPAPAVVYQSVRYGSGFSYSLPGLTPGTAYTVRLHFAETYYTGPGQRLFNVSINGASVLSSFDIYAAAGAMNKAVVKQFTATADSGGKIAIAFADVSNGAQSNGVEIITSGAPTIPAAPTSLSATAGNAQVALSWTGSASAVSYNIKRGTVSGGPYTTLGTASGLSYTDSTAVNGTTYFYVVTAVNSTGESAPSAQVSATPKASVSGTAVYQLNSGGGAVGTFGADQYYTGGSAWSSSSPIDLSGAANPAPAVVYQSVRYGSGFSYSLPGLTPGTAYTVRLHLAETYWTAAGQRLFNVSINGSQVLSNFDIYAAAGAANKAVVKQFTATANSSGKIAIAFTGVVDDAMCNGLEIITAS